MSKKSRAIVKCQIMVSNIKAANAEKFVTSLSPTLTLSNVAWVPGKRNQNKLMFEAVYGPVIGAYQSDVTAKVKRGLQKAGSTAALQVLSCVRDVV